MSDKTVLDEPRRSPAGSEAPDASPVDINTADLDTLSGLPRVGRVVAARIIEYRAQQPFAAPQDLMRVPGIGQATYDGLAGRIAVAPPPPAEPPPVAEPEAPAGDAEAEPSASPPEPAKVDAAGPTAQPVQAPSAPAAAAESPAHSAQAPQAPAAAAKAEPALRRDWTGLMAMSVMSAFLGASLALIILAGINRGTLSLNQQAEVAALSAQADGLANQAAELESGTRALRARLDALEGLTGRVDDLEGSLAEVDAALGDVEAEVSELNTRADALAAEVETMRAATARFERFLRGLRELLAGVLDSETDAPPEASPSPTPTS